VSFLLHFTGPSFQQTVTLLPGTPAVVIGRDPGAAVYLPDTKRLISRRHVSIDWFPEGARMLVLSSNGISTDLGDYFEGDLVTLGRWPVRPPRPLHDARGRGRYGRRSRHHPVLGHGHAADPDGSRHPIGRVG
jgi:hypothetical protein